MANTVTLTFAGDAKALERAAQAATNAMSGVGKQVDKSSAQFQAAGKEAASFRDRMDRLGTKTFETVSSLSDAKAAVDDLIDSQHRAKQAAQDLAQAQEDVNQAQLDAKQAARDGAQAQLDVEQASRDSAQAQLDVQQAIIDADQAQRDYNDAIKKHGQNSIEARQAAQDMAQAQEDLKQANLDAKQSQEDVAQANLDAEQATADARQASLDAQQAALDMAQAQREAADITKYMSMAIAAATIAQLALNVAMTLNPIGLVVVAIAALVAGIVWLATQTTFFQDLWRVVWGFVTRTAQDFWAWFKKLPDMIGDAFKRVTDFIFAPFRAAFNLVSRAWNNTIGKLSWTVPGWVPGVGGNTISAPKLPTYHTGGVVPGAPGSEQLALLQAGETVIPAGQSAGSSVTVVAGGGAMDQVFLSALLKLLRENNLKLEKA